MNMTTTKNIPNINSTNILSGIDADGCCTVHDGWKGQTYHVLLTNPPSPDGLACRYLDMLERDGGLIGKYVEEEA